jgi:tetratricopeptide (TPR) repeat protein
MDLGRPGEAVESMQAAVSLQTRSSQTHYLLGQAYLLDRKLEQARQSFLTAVGLRPDHTQAYFGLFTVCSRLGRTDEAARYRDRFLELEAADRASLRSDKQSETGGLELVRRATARTLTGAGQVLASKRDLSGAVKLWQRAALLDPDNMSARQGILAVYRARRRPEGALSFFRRLTESQPDNTLNYYLIGDLQASAGRTRDAEISYRKMTELRPDEPNGYIALAEHLLRVGQQPQRAVALAQRAVQLQPSADNYFLLARTCYATGDRPGALRACQTSLRLEPSNPRYQRLLRSITKGPGIGSAN